MGYACADVTSFEFACYPGTTGLRSVGARVIKRAWLWFAGSG